MQVWPGSHKPPEAPSLDTWSHLGLPPLCCESIPRETPLPWADEVSVVPPLNMSSLNILLSKGQKWLFGSRIAGERLKTAGAILLYFPTNCRGAGHILP